MTTERDIAYENDTHWVLRKSAGFEVYRKGVTHSVRCAIIGFKGEKGLTRAKEEADKRHAALAAVPSLIETKRRLLLSKWGALAPSLDNGSDTFECLRNSLDPDRRSMLDEIVTPDPALVEALETVRYWLLDALVHKRPVTDPRRILNIVENAL